MPPGIPFVGSPATLPFTLALGSLWAAGALLALARLRQLPDLPPPGTHPPPPVTVCIPARNEGRELGRALDAWLALDAPGLTLVVVDDGSTDGTPEILAARKAAHPGRLTVLRNDHLPPGWLGKNHALHLAASSPEALAAPWLIFADADVNVPPDLLARSFAFLEAHPGDLLALLPAVDTGSLAERAFLPWAILGFLWVVDFRRVPRPGAWAHCGVGAFMLVRREAYDAVDGHRGAPMDAIDDMRLAKRIKAAGYVNQVALGGPGLHLRMYHGLGDLVRSMRKNALGLPFLAPLAPLSAAVSLAATLGPLLLACLGQPFAGLLVYTFVTGTIARVQRRFAGLEPDWAWGLWPVNGILVAWGILWALSDRLRGVNHWRGRDVPLG